IILFPGAAGDAVLELARSNDDRSVASFAVANRTVVTARLDWNGIMQLAELPEVEMIDAAGVGDFFNNEIRVVMQTEKAHFQANQAFYNPIYNLGVWGENQIVTVADSGILAGHDAYASGKLLFNYAVPGTCASTGDAFDHGTGVAATLLADTLGSSSGGFGTANDLDGLAVRADLIMQDIEDANQNFCAPNDYPFDLFFPAWQVGSMIHSNSWGHWAIQPNPQGSYSWRSQAIDWYMSQAPVREQAIIFAAGNAGRTWDGFATYTPYSLSDEAHAKNAIVVGGILNGNGRDFMYGFSSRGPTDDCLGTPCDGIQRVKPDVLAPAALQIDTASAAGVSAWTGMYEGTSYSAPAVAAAATLVRDYFTQGIYPVKPSDPPLGGPPSSALIKAMLVNATVPIFSTGGYEGNVAAGVAADAYPNYDQGYGRPALDNVLEPAGYRKLKAFEDDSTFLATGDVWSRTVNFKEKWGANSSCNNLRVTLAWNDPEGALLAGPKLVNNLDLEVTFNGTIYRGNHRLTGNTFDGVNNVEDVYLPMRSQALGIQHKPVIRVYGTSVPTGSQPFALVATYGACFDQIPCTPPPVAGGCYRGPGDTVPGAVWTPPVPGCDDQIYDPGEYGGSAEPFPFCQGPIINPVPIPIDAAEPLEPIGSP
ncbi:MAG: S8 family serine peptidase, partial [Wenzhouxiangellaceae bacterium]